MKMQEMTKEQLIGEIAALKRQVTELEKPEEHQKDKGTALRISDEQFAASRAFNDAILDTAASLVILMDREGRILRFNFACEKAAGYTSEEVIGQHLWDILSADPAKARERIDNLVGGKNISTYEDFWISKSGEKRLIAWSNTVLLNKEDKVEYIVGTGIDITERRQAEAELKEANLKLVTWVHELEMRSAEMSQLSEMGEQLQSCQNIEEACAISVQYIRKICPFSQGALYLINPSKELAEAVQQWGDTTSSERVFVPLDCWGIRRGRPHLVDSLHPGLKCGHIVGPHVEQHLCVPMLAHGEAIGILHLNLYSSEADQENAEDRVFSENKAQVIMAAAEDIALALSNLYLRESLRQQSIRDILTGLFNRRYMQESLERELSRAEREKIPVGVIMFDIDNFKDFNDVYGHDGGDALLHQLGTFLLKKTRGGDIVCRYGGEEFVVVLPSASLENTRIRAEEIRKGVKDLLVYHLGKPMRICTLSLGVSAFPERATTSESLIKSADTALYSAKSEGRDRVVVADNIIA